MKELKKILPDFPRTPHLPYKPNAVVGDIVSKDFETSSIFADNANVFIEEKIDGASCGMCLYKDNAVIRNRNHILRKGYKKDTPAKAQFLPAWGWFYNNKERFQYLENIFPEISVYGEWVYALHGIRYDKLPDLFIAYDIYDYSVGKFLATNHARELLISAGFTVPPLLHTGKVNSWEQLESLCNEASAFSTIDQREGLYLRINDGKYLTSRYKMIRSNYVQGCRWNLRNITKNQLV